MCFMLFDMFTAGADRQWSPGPSMLEAREFLTMVNIGGQLGEPGSFLQRSTLVVNYVSQGVSYHGQHWRSTR